MSEIKSKIYTSDALIQSLENVPKSVKQNNPSIIKPITTLKSDLVSIKKTKKPKKEVKFNVPEEKQHKKVKDLVFLDIGTQDKYYGKLIIELFSNSVPHTCENFRVLCETKKYFNSPFHRIVQDFMIQGGDFTKGNGTGGESIFGNKFPDENFNIPHDRPYLLSMANSGPNTNGSQFFITTGEQPHLDGKHVVFGEIIVGFDVIDELNQVRVDQNHRPLENITVLNCGIYDKKKVYSKKKQ
jgi:cyclophilin family peptidyl-prolyl cis-trans isomerase